MKIKGLEKRLKEQYLRPEAISLVACPGCGHGLLRGLLLRVIDELQIDKDNLLIVPGIGCFTQAATSLNLDTLHALHGRAIAYATGVKVFNPKITVIVWGGDGDLGDIGGNHLIHGARRNIDLTVILANNGLYGMTGGQISCTTPFGAKTSVTTRGNPYRPFDFLKLVKAAGAAYVARYSVTQPFEVMNAIKKGLQVQGFSFVEVLTPCPTQFGRRNELESPTDMFAYLMGKCISQEEAKALGPEELKDKIITGEFYGD